METALHAPWPGSGRHPLSLLVGMASSTRSRHKLTQRCFCLVSSVTKGQNVVGPQPKAEARPWPGRTDRMVAGVPIIVPWACMSWPSCPGQRRPWLALAFESNRMMTCIHENCRARAYSSFYSSLGSTLHFERQSGSAHAINIRFRPEPHLVPPGPDDLDTRRHPTTLDAA